MCCKKFSGKNAHKSLKGKENSKDLNRRKKMTAEKNRFAKNESRKAVSSAEKAGIKP